VIAGPGTVVVVVVEDEVVVAAVVVAAAPVVVVVVEVLDAAGASPERLKSRTAPTEAPVSTTARPAAMRTYRFSTRGL
jgi:hypothetical protein